MKLGVSMVLRRYQSKEEDQRHKSNDQEVEWMTYKRDQCTAPSHNSQEKSGTKNLMLVIKEAMHPHGPKPTIF